MSLARSDSVDILAVSVSSFEEQVPDGTQLWPHVRLFVNGEDLLDLVREAEEPYAQVDRQRHVAGAYLGLQPGWVLPPSRHFLGEPEADEAIPEGKTILLGCNCGVPECSPLVARVTLTEDTVTWSELGNPNFPSWVLDQLGPFTFNKTQYEAALNDARWDQANSSLET
jgi:hypothetical protein